MLALERQIRVNLFEWPELDVEIQDLIVAAEEVRHNAWAPYSHYKVGVALLSQSGSVHIGCNVERASYTQTTHAEQNAIDSMVAAEGPNDLIDTMVIIGGPEQVKLEFPLVLQPGAEVGWKSICPSCGHCLQCIYEHCVSPDTKLIQPFPNGLIAITTLGDALPMRFGPIDLGIRR